MIVNKEDYDGKQQVDQEEEEADEEELEEKEATNLETIENESIDSDSPSSSYMALPENLSKGVLINSQPADTASSHVTNPTAKIVKLMSTAAYKEYQKALKRVERRRVRVPEILELLRTARPKEAKRLEEELRILMRKSDKDNLLLSRYMQPQLPLPKPATANLESASMTSLASTVHSRIDSKSFSNFNDMEEKKKAHHQFMQRNLLARESGYSSFEDSCGDIGKLRFSSTEELLNEKPLIKKPTGKQSLLDRILIDSSKFMLPPTQLNKVTVKPSHLRISNEPSKLDELAVEFSPVNVSMPAEITVAAGSRRTQRRQRTTEAEEVDDDEERYNPYMEQPVRRFHASSGGQPGSSVPIQSYSGRAAGSPAQPGPANISNNVQDTRSMNSGSSRAPNQDTRSYSSQLTNQFNPSQSNEQSGTPVSLPVPAQIQQSAPADFTTEYINESDLGPDYRENYEVEQDPSTGEFFILDYEEKIKYIIIKDKLGETLDDPNQPNNAMDDLEGPGGQVTVEYVTEADLNAVDLDSAEVYVEEATGEQVMYNRAHPEHQWIILPNEWRDSADSTYFAIEELDLASLDVFIDPATKRQYIVDENSGVRYYLVAATELSEKFQKKWLYLAQLNKSTELAGVEKRDRAAVSETDSGVSVDYVEERQIDDLNLEEGQIVEDEVTGEAVLIHPSSPNTRWIVLPNDWETSAESPYLNETDLELMKWDVFVEEGTQRRYVIDEKTGQRYFIVSAAKLKLNKFQEKWADLVETNKARRLSTNALNLELPAASVEEVKPTKPNRVTFNTKPEFREASDLMDDFETEPSNMRLRTSAHHSPDRVIDLNSRGNSTNLKTL